MAIKAVMMLLLKILNKIKYLVFKDSTGLKVVMIRKTVSKVEANKLVSKIIS